MSSQGSTDIESPIESPQLSQEETIFSLPREQPKQMRRIGFKPKLTLSEDTEAFTLPEALTLPDEESASASGANLSAMVNSTIIKYITDTFAKNAVKGRTPIMVTNPEDPTQQIRLSNLFLNIYTIMCLISFK